jgi:hypothetical protein
VHQIEKYFWEESRMQKGGKLRANVRYLTRIANTPHIISTPVSLIVLLNLVFLACD